MRKSLIAAVVAAGLTAPLAAQNAPAPAAPAQPAQQNQQQRPGGTPEDRARGVVIFRTFSIALNSDQVQQAVKNQLMTCLYNNPMRALSVATGNALTQNTSLDPKKPEHVYAAAAAVCGVRPAQQAQQAAPAQTPPAQPAAQSR
jgi:hypothetical protein